MDLLDSKKRYLIACSGGPDSMALLDIARKQKLYIEVAHVNYHKRDTAYRDQKIVKTYCMNYKIKFHKLDVFPENVKGNFQAFARKKRYEYFNFICKKHKLDIVLVAHHKDDHLETYLMQKQKNISVSHYGLAFSTYIYHNNVVRPLLNYSKNDLVNYCRSNNIEYGIDESNNTNHYTRNLIRHSRIDKMNDKQKNRLLKEIDSKNKEVEDNFIEMFSYLNIDDIYDVNYFVSIPHIILYLRLLFGSYSDSFYKEMLRQIKEARTFKFHNGIYYICKEYGRVSIFLYDGGYVYNFDNLKQIKTKKYSNFSIRKNGEVIEGVYLKNDDFPISIRNYSKGDQIKLRYGSKKVNRFFIDNKISYRERLNWPIIVDKNNIAIFVPKIGCDINHYSPKPNLYMVKL